MDKKELEAALAELKTKLDESVEAKAKAAIKSEIAAIEEKLKTFEGMQKGITDNADEIAKVSGQVEEAQKSIDKVMIMVKDNKPAPQTHKSFNETLKEAIEEKTDDFAKFARKEIKRVEVELKAVGDVSTANVTGSTVWGAQQRPGIIELPKRKVHVRQLVNVGTVGAGTDYYFMRQNGNGEGDPTPVAEGATKPQFDLDLVESSVKIETIAGWMRVTRKAMNNIPGFVSFLQSRLPEKLLRVEDEQLLYGDGVSPNIKGILTAGNFVASTSTAPNLVERIIDDLATLEDTYERNATGIVMRPVDYYGFFKNKATGSGEYDLPRNVSFVNGVLYISGIPAFATTALHSADYVVGDWTEGADFLIQEGMRLEFFEQDGTNVRENKVTVRIEETGALPVYGPDYFIKGTVPDEA